MATIGNIDKFLSLDNIAFRSACNGAVEIRKRPVSTKVVRRLSNKPESRLLVVNMLVADSRHGEIADCACAEMLAKSLCWQTLVQETVDADRHWKSIPWLGRIASFVKDKLTEVLHPATKAAATTAMGAGLLFGAYQISPRTYRAVTQPIRAMFIPDETVIPVKLTPGTDSGMIPVTFKTSAVAENIPVHFQLVDDGPLRLRMKAKYNELGALNQMQANLNEINNRLGIVEGEVSKLQDPLTQQHLITTIDGLKRAVNTEGATLLQQLPTYTRDVSKWGERIVAQDAMANQIALNQRLEFRIKKGATQIVVIPVITAAAKGVPMQSVAITFRGLGEDRGSRAVQLMVGDHAVKVSQGASCAVGTTSYLLSVESIDRNWIIYHSAHLILTPNDEQNGSFGSQTRPCWENESIARAAATTAPYERTW